MAQASSLGQIKFTQNHPTATAIDTKKNKAGSDLVLYEMQCSRQEATKRTDVSKREKTICGLALGMLWATAVGTSIWYIVFL